MTACLNSVILPACPVFLCLRATCLCQRSSLAEAFFILSSGLAGEVIQKFVNYHTKMAVYGDYSKYTSKPLHDFIYESNKGRDFFFVNTKEEAAQKLIEA